MDWHKLIENEKLTQWQRWLHQHPELAFEETVTSGFIYDTLAALNSMELLKPTPTSVIAVLKGARTGPTIGLRADIDALPMEEEAGVEFKSLVKGKMHACGHDAHTAMLLGAASALSQMKSELAGTVKFIFQHAEEYPPGGAAEIISSGLLDDVDCFFANHVSPDAPVGTVKSRVGPMMASVDSIFLNITGKGAHGGMPHQSVDPIVVGSEIVLNLNNIVARSVSPLDSAVISVGKFSAGTVNNVIPETAEILATVRATSDETRDFVETRINAMIEGICKAYGAAYDLEYRRGYAPLVNDEKCVEIVRGVAESILGGSGYMAAERIMAGDDFSAYQRIAPGAMVNISSGFEDPFENYPIHNTKFRINPGVLSIGAKMYVGYALAAMHVD